MVCIFTKCLLLYHITRLSWFHKQFVTVKNYIHEIILQANRPSYKIIVTKLFSRVRKIKRRYR